MIEDPIIQNVRRRAGLPSDADALSAICATLHTLAERITPTDAARLWRALPPAIAQALPAEAPPSAGRFSFDEFCQRLADREQTDVPVAVFHARTVLQALREALPDALESQSVAAQLTKDFAPLFWQPDGTMAAA